MRQQRNQDSHSIYRPKDSSPKDDTSPVPAQESSPPSSNQNPTNKSITSTPTTSHVQNNSSMNSTASPLSPRFAHNSSTSSVKYVGPMSSNISNASSTASNGSCESISSITTSITNGTATATSSPTVSLKSPLRNDKPIQKVTPSRNSTPIKYHQQHQQVTSPTNGNNVPIGSSKLSVATAAATKEYSAYVKPNSPAKPNTINCSNGSPATNLISTPKINGSTKVTAQKSPRLVH